MSKAETHPLFPENLYTETSLLRMDERQGITPSPKAAKTSSKETYLQITKCRKKSVYTISRASASSEKDVEDNIVKKHVKTNNVKIEISAKRDTPKSAESSCQKKGFQFESECSYKHLSLCPSPKQKDDLTVKVELLTSIVEQMAKKIIQLETEVSELKKTSSNPVNLIVELEDLSSNKNIQ